jgi:hypothetical protein
VVRLAAWHSGRTLCHPTPLKTVKNDEPYRFSGPSPLLGDSPNPTTTSSWMDGFKHTESWPEGEWQALSPICTNWSTQTASPSLLVNDLPADDPGLAYLAHLAYAIQSMSQTTIEDLSQGNTSTSPARHLLSPIEEVDETEPHQGTCTFSPFAAALGFLLDTDKFPTLATSYDTLEVEMSAFSPVPSSETGLLPDTDELPTVADLSISTPKRYPITLSAAGPGISSSQRYPSALSADPCRPTTQHRRERDMNSRRVLSALLSPVTPSWSPKQCATLLAVI